MSALEWTLVGVGVTIAIYLAFVMALFLTGRHSDARALAAFIPDCIVLFRRLLGDPRVSGWRKATIAVLIGYLAMPVDLVPDFIPVAGQLDDAIVVAFVLRTVLRSGGPELLHEHWPGPEASLAVISRMAYGRREPSLIEPVSSHGAHGPRERQLGSAGAPRSEGNTGPDSPDPVAGLDPDARDGGPHGMRRR